MKLSSIAAAFVSGIALCEGSTRMVIGYFPNWLYSDYPVERISFNKYTHINYAFAILNNQDNLPSFPDNEVVESSLPNLVNMAHGNQTKVLLSIGGWTGSKRFSPMVATPESRKKFIDWNLDFIKKFNTDGVDLDWEYPARQAAGCNEFSENDTDNYLLLLQELRQALDTKFPDEHKEISMAVYVQPFLKWGTPMTDLSPFVPYFDHVNLMTYDMNGAWGSTTGPNAPLRAQEGFSYVNSIRDWKAAGVPSNKITAGLAFYGRSIKAQVDMTQAPTNQFQASEIGAPQGDADDGIWADPYCESEPASYSGIWKWTNFRKQGLLKDDLVTPGEGWHRQWDNTTQTPWLFNPSTKHYISYDDPQSLILKVEHAVCENLAGVMVWDIHQDNGELLDTIHKIHNTTCPTTVDTEDEADNDAAIAEEEEEDMVHWSGPLVSSSLSQDEASFSLIAPTSPILPSSGVYQSRSISESKSSDMQVFSKTRASLLPTPVVQSLHGKSCSVPSEQKCVDSGKSSQWLTCNFDKWIVRDCSPGLLCYDGAVGLECDYPRRKETSGLESKQDLLHSLVSMGNHLVTLAVEDPYPESQVV
ncbi:glycosyl hydrolases family 18-domain-containing protein [Gilbertella persicaria]|uniref:glycosyl hydrolases family 18-domain-containing protein n=1 Tax=Gilbertella persicaria TaxID=101096 RepID=UPI0022203D39|nr:glycosyl hydrolases family 18-domain-containing protein [Gilbertella persicaria]KAI8049148.1 glycosyl hydrolases family 18-domain-containing protein [Gilbertella persicaria]